MTANEARAAELAELVRIEVGDIVATAAEQGFSAKETLDALSLAVAASATAAVDPESRVASADVNA